jgi:hypothetical protein
MLNYGFIALAIVVLAQSAAIWRMSRAMRVTIRLNERLSHFADALALLTDTTETGLASVAAELELTGRKRAARSVAPRAASKRIVKAARRGQAIDEIAAAEAISESEVRLHLGIWPDDAEGTRHGALRG